MADTTDTLGKSLLRMAAHAPPGYWENQHAEWEADPTGPEPPATLTEHDRQMLTDGSKYDVTPSREHIVEMSFAAVDEMTYVLMTMPWRLIRFDEPCLFTSEHPITYWRRPSAMGRMFGIGPLTADEVRLPVSPRLALILTPPEPGRKPFDPSPREG